MDRQSNLPERADTRNRLWLSSSGLSRNVARTGCMNYLITGITSGTSPNFLTFFLLSRGSIPAPEARQRSGPQFRWRRHLLTFLHAGAVLRTQQAP